MSWAVSLWKHRGIKISGFKLSYAQLDATTEQLSVPLGVAALAPRPQVTYYYKLIGVLELFSLLATF